MRDTAAAAGAQRVDHISIEADGRHESERFRGGAVTAATAATTCVAKIDVLDSPSLDRSSNRPRVSRHPERLCEQIFRSTRRVPNGNTRGRRLSRRRADRAVAARDHQC